MFDVGFWEIMLIGVVALVVIGPERLPGVARTAGKWMGRGKRFLRDVKSDIDQELKADELKRILEAQQQNKPLQEIIDSATESANSVKQETEQLMSDIKNQAASEQPSKTDRPSDKTE
ncbi:MAG: Sec-independent protein translocase protein TatB [Chromatiales bacterium]|jgi:sec-independent protein translocase protein TatB